MKTIYLILVFLACITLCHAQVYYVKPTAAGLGNGSSWSNAAGAAQLQAIINAAATGSQVWVAAGTYYPNAYPSGSTGGSTARDYAFTLKNGVTVYGGFTGTETSLSGRNYSSNVTILSGDIGVIGTYTDDCYHVLISVGNNNTAILDGFTIRYGYANGGATYLTYNGVQAIRNYGGGIYLQSSQPSISNCIFINNTASSGGAVYNINTSSAPVFTGCTFSGNSATTTATTDGGGGIYNGNGTYLTLTSCAFSSNTSAADGGGIFSNNSCNMTLTSCSFTSNVAAGSGGGFINESSSIATLTSCSFSSNRANSTTIGGGGVCNYSTNGFTATSCSFSSNQSGNYGGGIYFTSGSSQSTMNNCTFTSNAATYGGGIASGNGSNQTVSSTTFASNSATYGGGVYNSGSSYTYSSCTFQSNSAGAATGMAGGGQCNDNSANGYMLHCLFLNNVSTGDGAGQYNNASNAIDSECVFNGNVSQASGGGIVYNGGNPKAFNCVLTDNVAAAYGGGLCNLSGNATFENCTVYNNSANSSGGYGDGVYVAGGSPKIYNDIVWSRSNSASIGLVYANGVTPKVQYSDTQGNLFSGAGNISSVPSFGNTGNYKGADGVWSTADDGLHLNGSGARDGVAGAAPANFPSYDITMMSRPDAGSANADMGAYEGPGTFVVLAVSLTGFVAARTDHTVVDLQWTADAASPALSYEAQRSGDGEHFSVIGTVIALAGQTSYTFKDRDADGPVFYYRLQINQPGGGKEYSTVSVIRENAIPYSRFSIRPSLTREGTITLYIGSPEATVDNLIIIDVSGRLLLQRSVAVERGDNYLVVNISTFKAGIYYLVVREKSGLHRTLTFEKL